MKTIRTLHTLLIGCVLLFAASGAWAQATRTWVSGVGDDANPCSRTAPCKTFAGAISKTAAGGTIDALDPGGFGALTITKAITLEAVGTVASVLVSGTNGLVVAAGTNDVVVIRGLTLEGLGGSGLSGIQFNSGAELLVERCVIEGFGTAGINFQPSATSELVVSDSTINLTSSSGPGIQIQGLAATPNVTLDRDRIVQNGGYGVLVKNGMVAIRHSTISQGYYGVKAISSTSTARIAIDDSILADNQGTAVSTSGTAASIVLARSTITDNLVGIGTGSTVTSFGDNRIFNNGTDGAPSGSQTLH
jgi:hypothetical protein